MRGTISSLMSTLQQAQDSVIQALQNRYSSALDQISSTYTNSISDVKNIMEKYAEMQTKAEVYKNELQIARFVLGTSLPTAIQEMPVQIAPLFIEAAARFYKEKGIDPLVSPPQTVLLTQPHFQYATLRLSQVIAWATHGIDEYLQTNTTIENNNSSTGGGLPA